MGYEPHSKRVWYRRGASGVRTALETCSVREKGLWGTNRTRNVFGTGEGSLGYELLSETCSVQERGLWGTERIQRECRYKGDVIIRLTITILTEIFDNYEELQ